MGKVSECKILMQIFKTDSYLLIWFMVFYATFNNISVIYWQKPEYSEKTTDKLCCIKPCHERGSNSQL